KALVKDPDYRYQSADEMRVDIEACLDGQPVAATAAMGAMAAGGYGAYPDDQPTTALRSDAGAGATSMLPPMNPDDGGYGYDERPDRRRQQPRKSNTSTIFLVLAGVLVLVGAILVGMQVFGDDGGPSNDSVPVPAFVGQTKADAQQLATNSDLELTFKQEPCEEQPKGNICSQNPEQGTDVKKKSTVDLVVSTGAPKVAVTNVIDKNIDEARQQLEDKGFKVETKQTESSQDEGTVLSQDPDPGTELEKGSTVTLEVAKAEERATVPDVLGRSCDEAKAQMQNNDLEATCTDQPTNDPNQVDKVISTTPAANQTVDKGSKVTIVVGKAVQKTKVPEVRTKSLAEARQILQQSGFTNVQVAPGAPGEDNAVVIAMDPQPGTEVDDPAATQITLTTVGGNGGGNGGGDNGGGIIGGLRGNDD
ncbi:PASTA domain-containing protein, partial [Streptomyces sp. NPDC016675]|uniref:Stk1 family PASTA domain-containing Ser/Thr kinase n=1 Tax=Streptomyces sp. NPDC016675 TaxID=3364970 RepID=UPI0036F4CA12